MPPLPPRAVCRDPLLGAGAGRHSVREVPRHSEPQALLQGGQGLRASGDLGGLVLGLGGRMPSYHAMSTCRGACTRPATMRRPCPMCAPP